jgi:hypothetical protein
MNPDDRAANAPSFDPLFTAVQRYTAPVTLVGIVFTFVVIGWALSLSSVFWFWRIL